MRKSELMATIREKLDGLHERNQKRSRIRLGELSSNRLRRARRKGCLEVYEFALEWLDQNRIGWAETEAYGIRTLHTSCGVALSYDRTGLLTYNRKPKLGPPATNESFPFTCENSFASCPS